MVPDSHMSSAIIKILFAPVPNSTQATRGKGLYNLIPNPDDHSRVSRRGEAREWLKRSASKDEAISGRQSPLPKT
jgi:hypothetical protein